MLILLGGLAVAGCAGTDADPPGPASYTSGDTIVRYAGAPRYPGGGTLMEDLTIGLVDGPEPYVFGRLSDAALGPGGVIYALDGQAQVVRAFDGSGRHVRDIGGPGSGPGEFRRAAMLAVAPDGTLYVGETSPGRVHVFAADGLLLDAWSFEGAIEGPIVVDTAGVVHVVLRSLARQGTDWSWLWAIDTVPQFVDVVPEWTMDRPGGTVRLLPDGTVVDTVPEPALPDLGGYAQLPSGHVYVGLTFMPAAWWSWSPLGHLVTGVTSSYTIDLRLPPDEVHAPAGAWSPGDSVLSIRRRVDVVELEPGEAAVVARQWEKITGADQYVWHGPQAPPPVKPAYDAVLHGQEGRMWVRVHLASWRLPDPWPQWGEPHTSFDIFEPDGIYVGAARGPIRMRPTSIRGDTLLAITTDELGVDRVERLVVRWAR
ncbi:MAG: hypothetical protein WEA24_06800 [Gemmatimonadota bacterium]